MPKAAKPEIGTTETPSTAVADKLTEAVSAGDAPIDTDLSAAPHSVVVSNIIRARVLTFCNLGAPDDIVEVDARQAADLAGVVDTDPTAVAYAESLKV
jgi:hypothetical protein